MNKDRMPPQIGRIVSEAVYDSKLESNPKHPVSDATIACYFINAEGTEQRFGTSYVVMSFLYYKKLHCDLTLCRTPQKSMLFFFLLRN
jgi:hypothetical protein